MFSRAVALLSCRFTSSKRPPDVVSLFTSFYLRSKRYAHKKYARLKPKLPTQNKYVIIFPVLKLPTQDGELIVFPLQS